MTSSGNKAIARAKKDQGVEWRERSVELRSPSPVPVLFCPSVPPSMNREIQRPFRSGLGHLLLPPRLEVSALPDTMRTRPRNRVA